MYNPTSFLAFTMSPHPPVFVKNTINIFNEESPNPSKAIIGSLSQSLHWIIAFSIIFLACSIFFTLVLYVKPIVQTVFLLGAEEIFVIIEPDKLLFGIITNLFSKFLILVCLNPISSTVPTTSWASIVSPTINGLLSNIDNPPKASAIVFWAAKAKAISLSYPDTEKLAKILVRHTLGFGLIEVLLQDEKLQDIVLNASSVTGTGTSAGSSIVLF